MEAISLPERQSHLHDFELEQQRLADRVFALSVYDIPVDISPNDLILFSLHIFDTPARSVNVAKLNRTFEACGEYGIHVVEGFMTATWPFIHMQKFMDSLERLKVDQLVGTGNNGRLGLTTMGQEASQAVFDKVLPH